MNIEAVVFDIGQKLAYYPVPLNWSDLYRPALERIADKFDLQISEAEYEHIVPDRCCAIVALKNSQQLYKSALLCNCYPQNRATIAHRRNVIEATRKLTEDASLF